MCSIGYLFKFQIVRSLEGPRCCRNVSIKQWERLLIRLIAHAQCELSTQYELEALPRLLFTVKLIKEAKARLPTSAFALWAMCDLALQLVWVFEMHCRVIGIMEIFALIICVISTVVYCWMMFYDVIALLLFERDGFSVRSH